MLGKKAIGVGAVLLIVAAVGGGIGAYLWLSQVTSELRTAQIRHKQVKALKAKIDFDHAKYLLNHSLWLGGEFAAWTEGIKNTSWQEGDIPNRSTVEDNLKQTIRNKIGVYTDKIKRTSDDEKVKPDIEVGSDSEKIRIANSSFEVNITRTLETSFEDPKIWITDSFNYSRNFSLRYGLLYENAAGLSKMIKDYEFQEDLTESITHCRYVNTSEVLHKVLYDYKDEVVDEIGSIEGSFSPSSGMTLSLQFINFGYKFGVDEYEKTNEPCLYEMGSVDTNGNCDWTCDNQLTTDQSDIGDSDTPHQVPGYTGIPQEGTYQEANPQSEITDFPYTEEDCTENPTAPSECGCGCDDSESYYECFSSRDTCENLCTGGSRKGCGSCGGPSLKCYSTSGCDEYKYQTVSSEDSSCDQTDYEWICGDCTGGSCYYTTTPYGSYGGKECYNETGCSDLLGSGSCDYSCPADTDSVRRYCRFTYGSTKACCYYCYSCDRECEACNYRHPDFGVQWRKWNKTGTITGKWVEVKFIFEDTNSKILTDDGFENLKFIRRYNTTIP